MPEDDATRLRARLDAFIDRPMSDRPTVASDPVNVPMIRHWVDALDDQNPAYLDETRAATGRFGGIVAPPAMLQAWTMGRPTIQGLAERGGSNGVMSESPITVLDEAGYTSIRATNSELEFVRYLRIGDELQARTVIESISEEKQTALGRGFFVTWVTTYTDAQGEVVGSQRFRVFKFKAGTARAS
jgi:uncharacterized protein